MEPIYTPAFSPDHTEAKRLLAYTPWERRTDARSECFMAPGEPVPYTYGRDRGVRTYHSIPMTERVAEIMRHLNIRLERTQPGWGPMTGCFLNRYDHEREHLGWHADDFVGMDHSKCVAVVSFGAHREIWWRENGATGEVPPENRQLLEDGSLFIMPPGMQHTHQHRIPKGGRQMGPRVSLTFRAFFPAAASPG